MIKTQIETLTKKDISEIDFPEIDKLISNLRSYLNNGKITKNEILTMNQCFGQDFLENTIQGHGIRKPFGYSGDFLIIDKIYTFHKSPIEKYKIWDEYFHLQSAPKAVRNRKDYFKKILKEKLKTYKKINLMNVASGPARDLFELYEENKNYELNTVCVEMDENAIEYAKNLNLKYLNKISFIHKNIFRHKEESKYDVIWSAGLFDYFDKKSFVLMLKKFKEWLNDNGEIIIGNFNENHNPSRDYMEILGDWHLHHRTEIELKELAVKAGFNPNQIIIGKEKENVNLFLHIKN
jgi:2-polyprenyl-3-methyl-5-hydroxy-6-metoxy-1,4-benzoquinol methylase